MTSHIEILIPVFNDWESLEVVLMRLATALANCPDSVSVLIVDDGSEEPAARRLPNSFPARFAEVRSMRLRRNLGHQRAIAVGLAFLESEGACDAVVVIDGDGEDRPEDVPSLVDACHANGFERIVFAERIERSESWMFQTCYRAYRWLYYFMTGRVIRVGNFSIIPRVRLESLVAVAELWNHYPAAADKSRQPMEMIPTSRGWRIAGKSQQSFESLIIHGLSAISVHAETLGVRMLILNAVLLSMTVATGGAIGLIQLSTDLAIPGWTGSVGVLLVVVFIELLSLTAAFVFLTLHSRTGMSFIPKRDYAVFVQSVDNVATRFQYTRERSVLSS